MQTRSLKCGWISRQAAQMRELTNHCHPTATEDRLILRLLFEVFRTAVGSRLSVLQKVTGLGFPTMMVSAGADARVSIVRFSIRVEQVDYFLRS
jgi:hypothetical protein